MQSLTIIIFKVFEKIVISICLLHNEEGYSVVMLHNRVHDIIRLIHLHEVILSMKSSVKDIHSKNKSLCYGNQFSQIVQCCCFYNRELIHHDYLEELTFSLQQLIEYIINVIFWHLQTLDMWMRNFRTKAGKPGRSWDSSELQKMECSKSSSCLLRKDTKWYSSDQEGFFTPQCLKWSICQEINIKW